MTVEVGQLIIWRGTVNVITRLDCMGADLSAYVYCPQRAYESYFDGNKEGIRECHWDGHAWVENNPKST